MPLPSDHANMDMPGKINVDDIPWQSWGKGRFVSDDRFVDQFVRFLKISLVVTRINPGGVSCPFHFHHVGEELFYVLEGSGTLRYGSDTRPVRAGDVVSCPPGPAGAHQFRNDGGEPLVYLAISTEDHETEICEYPDSGKIAVVAKGRNGHPMFRGVYRKEHKAGQAADTGGAPAGPAAPAAKNFDKPYLVNVDTLPWETFGDPGMDDRIPQIRSRRLDLAVTRLSPGMTSGDFHFHHASEELFFVLEGNGTVRYGAQTSPLRPGDVISCPPGPDGAHQIQNTGGEPLVYLAISTEDFEAEVCEYPDSGKVRVWVPIPELGYGHYALHGYYDKADTVDYFEGELEAAASLTCT